jgi:biopolymer transport protein ExbD
MQAGNSSSNDIITNMQLAPLVDIALVLVIIFMVTAPLLDANDKLQVDLPKAATIEAKSEDNITITLDPSGQLALNQDMMPVARLEAALKNILSKHPDRLVLIRADKKVLHQQILEILNVAKKSGAKKIAIATLQRSRKQ